MRSSLAVLAILWSVVLVPGASTPAAADETKQRSSITEAELQKLVQDAGYRAMIASDDQGPYIDSSASGQRFYIGLYDCDEATPKQCNILELLTDNFPASAEVAKAKALEWNNSTRWWSRVMLDDEGKASLIYNVSIAGGVSDRHINIVIDNFVADIEEFQQALAQ